MSTNLISSCWYVIINPVSGSGKGRRMWEQEIKHKLDKSGLKYIWHYTQHENHAIDLVKNAIKTGYRKFVVVGGDGTHNEVVNGIIQQQIVPSNLITLASIPLGTGNDWVKTLKIPNAVDKAIAIIKNGKSYVQDVGLITYHVGKTMHQRYFCNVAGIGFDAFVGKRMNNKKRYGRLSYYIAILTSIFDYKNIKVRLKHATTLVPKKVFAVSIGICKYFGGGMKITPNAIPNDGLFDVTIMNDISKLTVFQQLKNLPTGTFLNHPKIDSLRTNLLNIESDEEIYVQADGELLGHAPFTFEVVSKALQVMIDNETSI